MLIDLYTCYLLLISCLHLQWGGPEMDCQRVNKTCIQLHMNSWGWLPKEDKWTKRMELRQSSVALNDSMDEIEREKRLKFPYSYCLKAFKRLPLDIGQNKTKQ